MGDDRARVARRARRRREALNGGRTASRDVVATQRNAVVGAWEPLTSDPVGEDLACHALRGELGVVTHSGRDWVRRQYELKRGARIWFTVDEANRTVHLLAVHTRHPNATK